MRSVFFLLLCLMSLFAAVQYNDPDGLLWVLIYSVPAVWCAMALFCQQLFKYAWTRSALLASIVAALIGVVWYWPLTPRFWMKEVWLNVETAREGMGMMIVACVLLVVRVRAGRLRANGITFEASFPHRNNDNCR